MSRISIEVSTEEHQKIKVMASLQNKSIKDFILENIFYSQKELNAETIKAIKETKKEKNLNVYNSADDLFKKFGK